MCRVEGWSTQSLCPHGIERCFLELRARLRRRRRKRITLDGDGYYLDLVFFHPMHRLVAIVLKIGGFKPAHSERMPPGNRGTSRSGPEGAPAPHRVFPAGQGVGARQKISRSKSWWVMKDLNLQPMD